MKDKPKISVTEFTTDVNNGMTIAELTTKYGITKASVKQIAKQFDIKVKRSAITRYEIVDDRILSENIKLEALNN